MTELSATSQVYDDLTGGRISKPMTVPSAVIGEAGSYNDKIQGQAMREFLKSLDGEIDGFSLGVVRKMAHEHFDIPDDEENN